jgi:hypothetical protein
LGEATGWVFHSMRALEPARGALAKEVGASFLFDNWQTVIGDIASKVRDIEKQPKSPQKIEGETFFGAVSSHLYFVKNVWRNLVVQARDTYSDIEILRVMDKTVQFIESLCPKLRE